MPVSYSTPSVLFLLPSLELEGTQIYPVERGVDRNAVLNVAPDRDSLDKRSDHRRSTTGSQDAHSDYRWTLAIQCHVVKLREATTRISVFGQPLLTVRTLPNENSKNVVTNRLYTFSEATLTSIENRLNSAGTNGSTTIPIRPRLSTPEKLISPRPLGLTHILVVYATMPSRPMVPPVDPQGILPRRKKNTVTYPQVIELPINHLIFILNVPNLAPSKEPDTPLLPRRLHKELPRLLMYVPRLDTFPELVIYLHTKNQAGLFTGT